MGTATDELSYKIEVIQCHCLCLYHKYLYQLSCLNLKWGFAKEERLLCL